MYDYEMTDDLEMIDIYDWVWIFNEALMVCYNDFYGVIVEIHKINNECIGKLKNMPIELSRKIAEFEYGEKIIESIIINAVKEAKKAFEYKEWLKLTDQADTKNAREWFNCPEKEQGEFMEEHPGYFEIDPETGDPVDP